MYSACMPVALQIRDVPDDVRDTIAAEARREGLSVQAYLLQLVEREARVLRNVEAFERTSQLRVRLPPDADPVTVLRERREDGFETDRARGA